MKAAYLVSLLIFARAEIFVPDEITDQMTENASTAVEKNGSEENEDPFVSSTLNNSEENENENKAEGLTDSNDTASNLVEGETKNEMAAETKASEGESSPLENNENKLFSDTTSSKKPEVQTLKPGQAPKPGVPYWTEAFVDKKMKSVLVNVKTVTIIESIGSVKAQGNTSSTVLNSTVDPYIKIQLPSQKVSSSTRSPTKALSSTSTEKSSTSSSVTSKSKASSQSSTSARTRSPTQSSNKGFTSSAKSKVSSIKKKIFPKTSSIKKRVSSKTSSAKSSVSSLKQDAFAKQSSSSTSSPTTSSTTSSTKKSSDKTSTTRKEVENSKSLGSIFHVLKGMPSGGKQSESLYVEGTFKFPKNKSLNSTTYKMSGYIST